MKTRLFTVLFFVMTGNAVSAQSSINKLLALGEFRTVMSQTFHPAEEGNPEPIRSRAQEMADKACGLLPSDIPADFRTNGSAMPPKGCR